MTDPRWALGARLITLTPDGSVDAPQKIGIYNERGWCACVWPHAVLIKEFDCVAHERYPDFGVNNEVYVEGEYLELETLGPLQCLEPGDSSSHVERWSLFPGLKVSTTDEGRLYESLMNLMSSRS